MKIATWNINSLRARFDHLLIWLRNFQPDVLLLQELKLISELYPYDLLADEGYQSAVFGQKTYNGVAILSKYRIEDVNYNFEGTPLPDEARYIDALIDGSVRIASVYVPNGQQAESSRYPVKIEFVNALSQIVANRLREETPFLIGGDFNIAPFDEDATHPERWKDDVPFTQPERLSYAKLLHSGLFDAIRLKYPYNHFNNLDVMTWWDYRGGSFEKNDGLRIDHILLCPKATDLWTDSGTDRTPRTWEKPSDHTPVWCKLNI